MTKLNSIYYKFSNLLTRQELYLTKYKKQEMWRIYEHPPDAFK